VHLYQFSFARLETKHELKETLNFSKNLLKLVI